MSIPDNVLNSFEFVINEPIKCFKAVFIFFCLIFVGCNKNNISNPAIDCSNKTNEIKEVKSLIAGTYTWTCTYRYSFGPQGNILTRDTLTPTSIGTSIKYVFYEGGTFDFIENNQNKLTYKYLIDYGFNLMSNPADSTTIMEIKDLQTEQQIGFFRPFLCNDSAKFENLHPNNIDEVFYKRN